MSGREQTVIHEAVVFFDEGALVKEMLQVEFEAVLDQVVGIPEFAGREICACFLRINQRLQIVGAVFFLVDFDTRGYVNRSWNIPLQHLLENAGRGPDLGGGRIRLSCRSQCSIPWHSRQLWDPVFEGEDNSFAQMVAGIQRNRLGLNAEIPDITDAVNQPPLLRSLEASEEHDRGPSQAEAERNIVERVTQKLQQEYRHKFTALKEDQQLQLATLKSSLQQQTDQVHQHYQIQLKQLKGAFEATQKLLRDEKKRSQTLKQKLTAQVDEFQRGREQFQHQLSAQQREVENEREAAQRENMAQLQQRFDVELKARVEQSAAELREMLDMREVELFYREEQLGTLREEIARLRQERERLIGQGGDRLLDDLVESGVAFVAYQPGVDAMTIPVADIPRYLESPVNYVAEKCAVEPELYQQWLSHHELPVCTAPQHDGTMCGDLLAKIDRPSDFLPGSSDRCALHGEHQPLPKPAQQVSSS